MIEKTSKHTNQPTNTHNPTQQTPLLLPSSVGHRVSYLLHGLVLAHAADDVRVAGGDLAAGSLLGVGCVGAHVVHAT
jgi:hypothetical protein